MDTTNRPYFVLSSQFSDKYMEYIPLGDRELQLWLIKVGLSKHFINIYFLAKVSLASCLYDRWFSIYEIFTNLPL